MRRSRSARRRRLAAGGSGNVAGWPPLTLPRCGAGICPSGSVRRSPCCGRRTSVSARSRGGWAVTGRRSRGSCAATPRPRGGRLDYRASVAQWKAELLAQRPNPAKLVTDPRLHAYVQQRLAGQVRRPDGTAVAGPVTQRWKGRNKPRRRDRRWVSAWSPEQISHRLRVDFPDDGSMRISHEATLLCMSSGGCRCR